jgi:copper resistance protein C
MGARTITPIKAIKAIKAITAITAITAIKAITAVTALTGAAVLLMAAPAQAHSYLVASTPSEGEILTELPEAFSVTADETLLDLQSDGSGTQGAFALQIRDAEGSYYGDGCVSVVDATMSAEPAIGDSGEYTMVWQVVSADGHPVSGEIPFTWNAPAGFERSESLASPPVCGEDAAATPSPEPEQTEDPASPWIMPITIVLGALVLILAVRSARLQMRARAANRGDLDRSNLDGSNLDGSDLDGKRPNAGD